MALSWHSTQANEPSRTGVPPAPNRQPMPTNLSPPEHGEGAAQRLLAVGEDVDAEGAGLGDARPTGRGLRRSQGHHWRFERERGERLAGEADRRALLHGRHHGHAGGEVAQHLAEPGLVEVDRPGGPKVAGVRGGILDCHAVLHRRCPPTSGSTKIDAHALAGHRHVLQPPTVLQPAGLAQQPVRFPGRCATDRGGRGGGAWPPPRPPPGRRRPPSNAPSRACRRTPRRCTGRRG